uniref:Uncharacterized protein n=1 Tax=Ditylenchus dipsaci TaxID=166011 RepID=A0A915DFS6_9BILA
MNVWMPSIVVGLEIVQQNRRENQLKPINDSVQNQGDQTNKQGAARIWTTVKECTSKEDLDQWMVENKDSWSYKSNSRNISKKFADEIHRCDHSKRNRPGYFNCIVGMRVRYVKDLNTSSKALIQTSGENWHKRFKDTSLSSPLKESIEEKDDPFEGMTASLIDVALAGLKLLTAQRIQNQESYRTIHYW